MWKTIVFVCWGFHLVNAFKSFPRFNFEYNHLDKPNLERLERVFYLKNRRYSPYKNKFTQSKEIYNVTEVLESLNNEFMKNLKDNQQLLDSDDGDMDLDDLYKNLEKIFEGENINDDTKTPNASPSNSDGELGFFDDFGVYRYKNPNAFTQRNPRQNPQKSNNDFSGEGNFQILRNPEYTFQDIGGYNNIKQELLQTSDILLNYEKYRKYNVRAPKGIILEGPPGNGKTLMAKGFSGEINVTFIPVSGSEFSEKYVGVGAARVRELFKLAYENTPCIIFIDEIDALARKRGMDMVSSNSEKDQTLNQLLINLDGFKQSNGVFVIGATNRLDMLDPAILRPGRIDKNIFIGNPDAKTRQEIIQIHIKNKPVDPSITIDMIVDMTGGCSGAQIENLLNESMLKALRENREIITNADLEYVMNRVLAGWQSSESKYSDDIIDRIIIHEMGHAVVGLLCKAHPKLVKVCLSLSSPRSPGFTLFDNNDENSNIYTKEGLFSHLMVLLGGRIAEEIFFGYSVTTGARKDLDEAYQLANKMIMEYGMGKQNIYPTMSDHSKFLIDQEINELLFMANDKAAEIISNSREFILETSQILKHDNLLKQEQLIDIMKTKYPLLLKTYNIVA